MLQKSVWVPGPTVPQLTFGVRGVFSRSWWSPSFYFPGILKSMKSLKSSMFSALQIKIPVFLTVLFLMLTSRNSKQRTREAIWRILTRWASIYSKKWWNLNRKKESLRKMHWTMNFSRGWTSAIYIRPDLIEGLIGILRRFLLCFKFIILDLKINCS